MARLRVPESVPVPLLQRLVEGRTLGVPDSQSSQASLRPTVLLQPIEHSLELLLEETPIQGAIAFQRIGSAQVSMARLKE